MKENVITMDSEVIGKDNVFWTCKNRDGKEISLIEAGNNIYQLKLSNDKMWAYVRYGLREGWTFEDSEYSFVDPSGGPFISLESKINGKEVIRIFSKNNKVYIYLK